MQPGDDLSPPGGAQMGFKVQAMKSGLDWLDFRVFKRLLPGQCRKYHVSMAIKAIIVDNENVQHLIIGLNREDVESLLEFPYPYVEPPFSRYKKFPTPADGSKYFQPAETRNHLYILPPVKEYLSDPSIKLCGIEVKRRLRSASRSG